MDRKVRERREEEATFTTAALDDEGNAMAAASGMHGKTPPETVKEPPSAFALRREERAREAKRKGRRRSWK